MTKTPIIPIPPEVRKYVFTRNKYQKIRRLEIATTQTKPADAG
ncbi:MAG: hypothetical protein ABI180_16945 [Microcoleus sp.]